MKFPLSSLRKSLSNLLMILSINFIYFDLMDNKISAPIFHFRYVNYYQLCLDDALFDIKEQLSKIYMIFFQENLFFLVFFLLSQVDYSFYFITFPSSNRKILSQDDFRLTILQDNSQINADCDIFLLFYHYS